MRPCFVSHTCVGALHQSTLSTAQGHLGHKHEWIEPLKEPALQTLLWPARHKAVSRSAPSLHCPPPPPHPNDILVGGTLCKHRHTNPHSARLQV
jgi:hypothetical protein